MSIHVFTLSIATIISSDDAVRIYNRSDPKLKHVSHLMANNLPADEKIDEAVYDERRMSLTAVLPANYDDDGLLYRIVLALV